MAHLVNPRASVAVSLRAAAAEPGWDEHSVYAGADDRDDAAFAA